MRPFDPRVLRRVPQARSGIVGLLLLGAVQGVAAIGQAFAVAAVVVALVERADRGQAMSWLIGTFLVRAAAAGATELLAARVGAQVSTALRSALLRQHLAREVDPRRDNGDLLTLAVQGATSIEPYVARYLPTLANAAILPPAAIIAMLRLDWPTALIVVCTVPLLPVFAALIGSATAEAIGRRWTTLQQLAGHYLDVMRGLPTLVNYGRAEVQTDAIRDVSERHRRASVETLKIAFVSSAALELLATISVAIVAVWVGIKLAQGEMALGVAMPLILLAPEAYWPIRRLGAEFHNAADGSAALARVLDQLADTPYPQPRARHTGRSQGREAGRRAVESPLPPGDDLLGSSAVPSLTAAPSEAPHAGSVVRREPVRLRGVAFAYGQDPRVLDDFELELPPVGLTVVTGPSGVGKTTLLDLVAGLRKPLAGTVEAPRAHLITQRPFLAPATLRENLALGIDPTRTLTDGHMHKALADVGLAEDVRAFPEGLGTRIGDDGFGLSAGQRARVALARAILADTDLLLLDEPTAHLDPEAERTVEGVLVELARARSVIVVSHREGLLPQADRHLDLGAVR